MQWYLGYRSAWAILLIKAHLKKFSETFFSSSNLVKIFFSKIEPASNWWLTTEIEKVVSLLVLGNQILEKVVSVHQKCGKIFLPNRGLWSTACEFRASPAIVSEYCPISACSVHLLFVTEKCHSMQLVRLGPWFSLMLGTAHIIHTLRVPRTTVREAADDFGKEAHTFADQRRHQCISSWDYRSIVSNVLRNRFCTPTEARTRLLEVRNYAPLKEDWQKGIWGRFAQLTSHSCSHYTVEPDLFFGENMLTGLQGNGRTSCSRMKAE